MIVSPREYEIPTKYQALYKRAMTGKSRKDSVRAHCLMCCGWQENEVALCTATRCPLYLHRMGRRSESVTVSPASEE
ncbi:MAG: hypothetical protein O7D91_18985 [Planctomycetota bacterium]|nr:hypothetical protein [Planctomycetota bacterium]